MSSVRCASASSSLVSLSASWRLARETSPAACAAFQAALALACLRERRARRGQVPLQRLDPRLGRAAAHALPVKLCLRWVWLVWVFRTCIPSHPSHTWGSAKLGRLVGGRHRAAAQGRAGARALQLERARPVASLTAALATTVASRRWDGSPRGSVTASHIQSTQTTCTYLELRRRGRGGRPREGQARGRRRSGAT
jgi:hypothetical protein